MHKDGVPGFEDASLEEQITEVHRIFKETFSTHEGKKCLNILLNDLCFFDVASTPEKVALSNYAKYMITERLGVIDTIAITDTIINTESYTPEKVEDRAKEPGDYLDNI